MVRRAEKRNMGKKDEIKIKHSQGYNSIVTFQHLRYVIAAADNGSFRRAAEILLVRQSTLSRCIRQLEHSIGMTVFERSSGGVRATKAGLNFLRASRSILEQVASLVEAARILKPGGRLILLDLAQHDQEWVRSEWADQWLGFDERELRGWLAGAGLKMDVFQTLEGPEPAFSVVMIVATKEDKKRSK